MVGLFVHGSGAMKIWVHFSDSSDGERFKVGGEAGGYEMLVEHTDGHQRQHQCGCGQAGERGLQGGNFFLEKLLQLLKFES